MTATAVGSWPGEDVAEALAVVLGELPDLPHLPELPARGPGADVIGRTAALLVDLPVDLQPSGWRLVDRPGRDLRRGQSWLRQDLDALAEAADGYRGRLKVQVAGPWTLAASVWLPRGDRVVIDAGARRDLVASLAQGVSEHVADVRRLVPGADVVVQVDEPSLPAVMQGRLPTASGWGRLPMIEAPEAREGLRTVLAAAVTAGAATVVHSCAADVPVALIVEAGAQAASVDVALLGSRGWESVAVAVEAGVALWAGVVPTSGELPDAAALADLVARPWHELGLAPSLLHSVVLTPTCGLAACSPEQARRILVRTREAAEALDERAQD